MSLHVDDLRRLCDDGVDAATEDDGLVEKTDVDEKEEEEEAGESGESDRTRDDEGGVSVSFLRSGSNGEWEGEGATSFG